jgi:hypothetical protein
MFFISLFFKMMLLCVLNLPRFSGTFPDDSAKFAHDSAIGAAWFSRPKSSDFGYSSHRRRSRTREPVAARVSVWWQRARLPIQNLTISATATSRTPLMMPAK